MHAAIQALGAGPVEMFASSGGAVTAFALITAYPDDVATLVSHEPRSSRCSPTPSGVLRWPGGPQDLGGRHRVCGRAGQLPRRPESEAGHGRIQRRGQQPSVQRIRLQPHIGRGDLCG